MAQYNYNVSFRERERDAVWARGAPSGKKIVARSDIWAKNLRPPISCEAPAASQSYTAENIHELMSENLRSPIIGEARGASHV